MPSRISELLLQLASLLLAELSEPAFLRCGIIGSLILAELSEPAPFEVLDYWNRPPGPGEPNVVWVLLDVPNQFKWTAIN